MPKIFTIQLRSGSTSGPILSTTNLQINGYIPSSFASLLNCSNEPASFTGTAKIYEPSTAKFVVYGVPPGALEGFSGKVGDLIPSGARPLPNNDGWMVTYGGNIVENFDFLSGQRWTVVSFTGYSFLGSTLVRKEYATNTTISLGPKLTPPIDLGGGRFAVFCVADGDNETLELLSILSDGTGYLSYSWTFDYSGVNPVWRYRPIPVACTTDSSGNMYLCTRVGLIVLDSSYNITTSIQFEDASFLGMELVDIHLEPGPTPSYLLFSGSIPVDNSVALREQALLLKTDLTGEVIWAKSYRIDGALIMGGWKSYIEGSSILIAYDAYEGSVVDSNEVSGNEVFGGVLKIDAADGSVVNSARVKAPLLTWNYSENPGPRNRDWSPYSICKDGEGNIYISGDERRFSVTRSPITVVKLNSDLEVSDSIEINANFNEQSGFLYNDSGGIDVYNDYFIFMGWGTYGKAATEGDYIGQTGSSTFFCPFSELFTSAKGWYGAGQATEINSCGAFNANEGPVIVTDVTSEFNIVNLSFVRSAGNFIEYDGPETVQIDQTKICPPIVSAPDYVGGFAEYSQSSLLDLTGSWSGPAATAASAETMANNSAAELLSTTTATPTSYLDRQWVELDLGCVQNVHSISVGTTDGSFIASDYFMDRSFTQFSPISFSHDGETWWYAGRAGSFLSSPIETYDISLQARYIRLNNFSSPYRLLVTEFRVDYAGSFG